jgi:fructan beta-fructosidase
MNPASRLILSFMIVAMIICSCRPSKTNLPDQGPKRYSEQHRPQIHFSPDSMWMNDPNGLVFYEGEYHLFYQYHPYSTVWGPMHWGHAVSPDLVHWEHLPVALFPDSLGTIFSGSAVVDLNNTTGFGNGEQPPLVAIFTYHNEALRETGTIRFQSQGIAYSLDRGRSWTKYRGNPVIGNPGVSDFRDPKVIWNGSTERWIMALAAHDRILFYSSPNLKEWTRESEFFDVPVPGVGIWECPDLFPIRCEQGEKWVLLVSVNEGGPNRGSGTMYYIGDFDGHSFRELFPSDSIDWLDHGKDNYAGVTWSDIPSEDGRRIFMGWMSNWQYATRVPTRRWRNAMTLPRELTLSPQDGRYHLCSQPVAELQKIRKLKLDLEDVTISDIHSLAFHPEFALSQYELDFTMQWPDEAQSGKQSEFGIFLTNERAQQLVAGWIPSTGEVFIDRTRAGKIGFSENFGGIHKAHYHPSGNQIRFQAFVDRSSIELFIDDGTVVMTELFFPDEDFNHLALYSKNGSVRLKKGVLYSLESIW